MSDILLRTPHFPSTPNRLYTALIHEAHRKGEHKKDQEFQVFLYIIEMGKTGTSTSLILPSVLQVSSPKSKFFVYSCQETPKFRFTIIWFWCLPACAFFSRYHFCMYFWIKHSSHFFHKLTRKSKSFIFQENYQQENHPTVLSTWFSGQVEGTLIPTPNPPFHSCKGWLANSTFSEHLLTLPNRTAGVTSPLGSWARAIVTPKLECMCLQVTEP